jgi:hypothetical protein
MSTLADRARDRARDFWDRISPRERTLVVIAAICAPITIALWLGLTIRDGLHAMEDRNDETRRALAVIQGLKQRGETPGSEPDPLRDLPAEPISLDTYLDNAAKKAGFTLKGTTPRTPVTKGEFVTASVQLSVDDLEIDKLRAFLQEIETANKYVVVSTLEAARDRRERSKLDAKLVVTTYARVKAQPAEGSATPEGSAAAGKPGT